MKLYFVSLGLDGEFSESHLYLFRIGENPVRVLSKIKEEFKNREFHFDTLVELNYADGRRVKVGKSTGETLYAVFSGFYTQGLPLENHSVLFVVGNSPSEAKQKAKALLKTLRAITPHVDGIKELKEVEGYPIGVFPSSSTSNLFLYHDEIKSLLEEKE